MGVHNVVAYPQIKHLLGIPEDEPIFILRGQDKAAAEAISWYQDIVEVDHSANSDFISGVGECYQEFKKFEEAHPDRMKVPD